MVLRTESTSGKASEITAFSVITDTKNHIKYSLVSYEMTPDIALLDVKIPTKMPKHITANTGMDVLTHAIEAIKLVFKQLSVAYENGDDIKAREDMHNASALTGMAFTNASLGLVHSTAHKIGGEFGITHGLANAILLPYIVEYNSKKTDKFKEIEKQLEINDLVVVIKELNAKVGIQLTLKKVKEVEISEEKFNEVLDRMSKNAFAYSCTLTNPSESSAEDVKKIYECAFYGKSGLEI